MKAGKFEDARLLVGYARVSKGDEQNNAMQTKALKAAGCRRLFEEAASGGRWDRPRLHRMLDHTAMHLLQSGVDITVIALWLGHESPTTTHMYLEADLSMKERVPRQL